MTDLRIPAELLPADGRFGSGPAKVRPVALAALGQRNDLMGTSHRQAPVKTLVGNIRAMLGELYAMPDGYEVVLGNGGAAQFWDIAACSLIERRASMALFGDFGRKFVKAVTDTPFLDDPLVTEVEFGTVVLPAAADDVDVYAWPHNDTSTGAKAPVHRIEGAASDALTLVDGTSAAGGMALDLTAVDAYYFAPQKNFSSDGGLWIALASPAAIDRAQRVEKLPGRWVPTSLSFSQAAGYSVKDQTVNTPAVATLILLEDSLRWMLDNGGLEFVIKRTEQSSSTLYDWADAHPLITPFVAKVDERSPLVVTLNVDESIDVAELCRVARANGIVDIDPYRGINPHQIRISAYAAVDPADVAALTKCIDWILDRIA